MEQVRHAGAIVLCCVVLAVLIVIDFGALILLRVRRWFGIRTLWTFCLVVASLALTASIYVSSFWLPRWEIESAWEQRFPEPSEASGLIQTATNKSTTYQNRRIALDKLFLVKPAAKLGWLDDTHATRTRDASMLIVDNRNEIPELRLFASKLILTYVDRDDACRLILQFVRENEHPEWLQFLLNNPMYGVRNDDLRAAGDELLITILQDFGVVSSPDQASAEDRRKRTEWLSLSDETYPDINPEIRTAAKYAVGRLDRELEQWEKRQRCRVFP